MIIVLTTFGFTNVIDNLVEIGLGAILSWTVVGFLYFLPLALILAEFASSDPEAGGGLYSYIARGLGPTWAFVGTWSYFVANLVFLQSVFSRLPIRTSVAVSGVDVFESATVLLPFVGVIVCAAITWIAARGISRFSRLADWLGKATLALIAALVLVPLVAWVLGRRPSATPFAAEALVPRVDLEYLSTFAWLLFAVAGAEVAGPYVRQTEDPERSVPRAILLSTALIAAIYMLSTLAVAVLVPIEQLTKATGMYDIWLPWAEMLGLPGPAVGTLATSVLVAGMIGAYVVWAESPIRAMFADLPKGDLPERLLRRDEDGTHRQALWIQALVVGILILVPLLSILAGLQGSEDFLSLLNDLSSLSLVVPYVFVVLAYIQARRAGMNAPFQMVRSTPLAIGIGIAVLVVSAAGYLGAGLYALDGDPVDWLYVAIVYGGPLLLIVLGLLLRAVSRRAAQGGA